MNNRVTHFEIPANDPEKALNFFKTVFGWNFQQFGKDEYWIVITGDEKTPGINGAIMKKRDPNQPIVNTIQVENLDKHVVKIQNAGGKIVVPKMPVPTVGWLAYFSDPEGNIHGIWQVDPSAK